MAYYREGHSPDFQKRITIQKDNKGFVNTFRKMTHYRKRHSPETPKEINNIKNQWDFNYPFS